MPQNNDMERTRQLMEKIASTLGINLSEALKLFDSARPSDVQLMGAISLYIKHEIPQPLTDSESKIIGSAVMNMITQIKLIQRIKSES